MNYRDEWMKTVNEGTPHVVLPGTWQVLFTTDTARRVSNCRVCRMAIPKGMRRAVFMTPSNPVRKMANGGIITGQKLYCHIECIKMILSGDKAKASDATLCVDCGKRKANRAIPVGLDRRQWWGYLCSPCSDLPRYGKCESCGMTYRTVNLSYLALSRNKFGRLHMDLGPDALVCDGCVDSFGFVRKKEVAREERAEKSFVREYAKLIMRFESQGFLSDAKSKPEPNPRPKIRGTRKSVKTTTTAKSTRAKANRK